jgi:TatD DNase family protein
MYFDSHAHLTDPSLIDDLEDILKRAADAGVPGILSASVDLATSRKALEIARSHKNTIFAAVGVHPELAGMVSPGWEEELDEMVEKGAAVAVGEIGLDAHHPDPPLSVQIPVFRAQVRLAARHNLPLVLHSRKAAFEVLKIVEEEGATGAGGVFHCLEADEVFARAAVNAGFHLGVCGNVTYPRNEVLRAIAGRLPRERILIETDCPYLAPQPVRGKRNEPAHLVHTAAAVAAAMGVGAEECGRITTANARALFRLRS